MEETIILIILGAIFFVCLIGTSYIVITWRKDKKERIEFAKEEKKIDRTMPEHMRAIYKTWPKDRMILGNCPHCQLIMLTMHNKKFTFFCPACNVYWSIKLIEKPEVKNANSSDM